MSDWTMSDYFGFGTNNQASHSVEVSGAWGVLDEILSWCRENITGWWSWTLLSSSSGWQDGSYRFFFESPEDAVTFSLRWA